LSSADAAIANARGGRGRIQPKPFIHHAHGEWVPTLQAAVERLGAEDQWLDRQVRPPHDLADGLERAPRKSTHYEEIDVTPLVLISPRQRAEQVDGLGAQLGAETGREDL
jgi:hypothetical protein